VLITGETGIGKTRLAEELIEWATRQGYPALTAHCYAAEGQLAHAPIAEWLRAHPLHGLDDVWLTEVARLLPEILVERPTLPRPGPLTEDWQRLRLFKALAHALVQGHSSLLLFIEDLQWCDRDTLDWLLYILQTPLVRPVQWAIVGTVRTEETAQLQALKLLRETLARTGQLVEIELGPLTESATLALANHVAGRALDAELGPLLFQGTEGHPLFVVEMVRAGLPHSEASVTIHAHARIQSARTLPLKVRQVIEARLAQLSAPARELVGLAAVVGRAFTFDVLKHASGTDEETLVRALDELWQRRIVREQGEAAYDFSHDKIREIAYADQSSVRRRWRHRQVAEALITLQADQLDAVAEQIAGHYERAGLLEQAAQWYRQAAQTAHDLYANQDALEHYEHAIQLTTQLSRTDEGNATLAQLYESCGDILDRTGQHDPARKAYECALDRAPAIVSQARLYRKLGRLAQTCDRNNEALAHDHHAEIALGDQPASTDWWQA
jgi:predicted ATPase